MRLWKLMTGLFLLLMLPATVLLGLHDVLTKKVLSRGVNEQALLAANFIVAGLVVFIISLIAGWPIIKEGFGSALAGTIILNIFSQWCWYKAFQLTEVSLISPLRLITPPLTVITGAILLGETPRLGGVIGISIIVIALWLLLAAPRSANQPARSAASTRGIWLAVLGSILFALSFPLDKKAVITSSAFFFLGFSFPLVGLGNILIHFFHKRRWPDFGALSRAGWLLPLYLLIHTLAAILSTSSLKYALVAYASAIKRLWSFWAVVFSGAFLRERNIGRKLLATLIMLAGIFVTILLG